uniref:Reverse transcriptase domain-containing protein n=1 Tax=Tanacetum cinerariifolium TaxID=118510 RepID=A0A6L2NE18_TANCI|nr:reverse transcriptase domain-containing protein [Tanacetum cinerariifolium]
MVDQHTMAQLLQAPTEVYEDAIVVSAITADNFKLKHGLLTLVQNKHFFGHDKEDPHAHIRYFNKITSTLKFPNVPNMSIKLMLFSFSLEVVARIWLEKEPPRLIFTWDDLVSKFINQFFPPSKTTNLRNEITNFQQRFDESFNQDSLNSAVGGNFLDKMPRECLAIIESKSKVRYSRNKPVVAKALQSESPISISKPVTSPISEPAISLVSASMPNPKASILYPSRRNDERYREKANNQIEKFYQIFKYMSFEICFADALILMSKFTSTLKALIGNKEKLSMAECLALADLGASINLMPFSMWKRLSLPDLTPTCMTLELADRSISRLVGVAEDVYVKEGSFHFLADFVVVDFDADPRVPLILRRSFLKTGRALIDVFKGELTLQVGKESITFNLDQTLRYSANYSDVTAKRIDIIDMAREEYFKEVLGFSYTISSGNPTPYYDLIVSATSLTLTLFEKIDFLLEVVDAFLAIEDEPTSSEFHQSYLDPEGDILLLELSVIIAKDLSLEEKTALITVLKSHKRAIAWKLSDIKGMFQSCMMAILHGMIKKTIEVFMDDFSVFGNYFQSCLSHLERMLKRCEDTNLCLNWEKSHFMVKEGIVLGHKISKQGIEVDKAKVDVISKLPHPTTVKVLGKHQDKHFRPIHYADKTMTEAESNNTTTEKEMLAVSSEGVYLARKSLISSRLATLDQQETSGQVEVSNRGLKRIMERAVGENLASWSDKLDDDLWAFRTAYKTPIRCTPYKLVYRKACHLPVELEHKAYWALKHANFDLKTASDHSKV